MNTRSLFVVSNAEASDEGTRVVVRNASVFIAATLVAGCMQTEPKQSPVAAGFRLDGRSVLTASARVDYGPTVQPIVINNDFGGELAQYVIATRRLKISGEAIQFRGQCDSACTLLLSLPKKRLCVYPGASFGFHRAYGASAHLNKSATAYMRRTYPVWVDKWIETEGGLTSDIKRMNFDYVRRHLPLCPQTGFRGIAVRETHHRRRSDDI